MHKKKSKTRKNIEKMIEKRKGECYNKKD